MNPEITHAEKISPQLKSANFVRLSFFNVLSIIILTPIVIFIILFIRGQILSARKTEAISNAKQIGIAISQFKSEYDNYPSESTADIITKKHSNHGHYLTGYSSNAIFRQLIAAKIVQNEAIFYAKIKSANIPDGNISPGQALKKGEVGFAYITGLTSSDNSSLPLLLAPIIPGTTKFDPKPFDGRALVLRVDDSARFYLINKDGHIMDKGIDILSPKHPIWKGKKPTIHYPE